MKIGSLTQSVATSQKAMTPVDALTRDRQEVQSGASSAAEKKSVPQEEVLNKVKALLDGSYSIRFELDQKSMSTVIRLVDTKSGDVIRQIPPEEFLQMAQMLAKPAGQLLHTTS